MNGKEREEERERMMLEFRKRNIIVIGDKIDERMATRFLEDLCRFNFMGGVGEIRLYINSGGGSIRPAFRIFDAIRLSKIKVVGLVHGRCDSAAVTVLQACHSRLATTNSSFHLHFICTTLEFKANEPREKILKKLRMSMINNREAQLQTETLLSARTGLSVGRLRRMMKEGELYERRLTADEAMGFNLIDKVVCDYDLFSIPPQIFG